MRKKRFLWRRVLPLLLSASLMAGSGGVGAEELSSGMEEQRDFSPEENEGQDFSYEEDSIFETAPDSGEEELGDGIESGEQIGEEEELSAASLDYIKGRPMTEEEKAEQLAPFENLTGILGSFEVESDFSSEVPQVFAANLPETYDSRAQGIITIPKNQNPYSHCWSYVMASLMETSMLMQGRGTYDLSEEQLAYLWLYRVKDPLGNTEGDQNILANGNYRDGGNPYLASMHLSTGSGMALEEKYPAGISWSEELRQTAAYDTAVWLKDAVFSKYNEERAKNLILQYGAAGVLLNMNNRYLNADTAAYSHPSANGVNHAVTLVGWDDHYSRENFLEASEVTEDGAWIVKNSWGSSWENDGFFYISYQDTSLDSLICATATENPAYRNNYFYDGSAGLSTTKISAGSSIANVYQAKATDGTSETLGEITTAVNNDGVSYAIQVYTGLTDPTDPTSGTPAYEVPLTYTQTYAGIDTIGIPEVVIPSGSYYSIVLKNNGSKTISYFSEKTVSYGWCSFVASIEKGQSFFGAAASDGSMNWTDLADSRVTARIKAHTGSNSYGVSITAEETLTLEAGQKEAIQASITPDLYQAQGFTYISSDEEIAQVDAQGMVTGIKGGQASIEIHSKAAPSVYVTCRVTVKPQAPEKIRLTTLSSTSSQIQWSTVEGAEGYTVYRSRDSQNGRGIRTLTSSVSGTLSYTDRNLPNYGNEVLAGVEYGYYVRAFITVDGKKVHGEASAVVYSGIPMYRLYNPYSGEHFYTSNEEERDHLDEIGWNYEGVAWIAPHHGTQVYRLYNPAKGMEEHHYTSDLNEIRVLTTERGWNLEGPAWKSESSQGLPMYRLYNPYATSIAGAHHFTLDQNEKKILIQQRWRDEGIAWYGMDQKTFVMSKTDSDSVIGDEDEAEVKVSK